MNFAPAYSVHLWFHKMMAHLAVLSV